jgi:ribosome-associated protein
LMNSQQMADCAVAAVASKKAIDIRILDMREVFPVADYFVICSGWSTPQLSAIAREVEDQMEKQGYRIFRRQGTPESQWILLDYGDVIVHIFSEDARQFYTLERLWGDAKVVQRESGLVD